MDEIKITEDKKPEGNKEKMLRSVALIIACVVMLCIAFAVGGCVKGKKNNTAESDSTQTSEVLTTLNGQNVTLDVNALASALAGATTQPSTAAVESTSSTDTSAIESSTDISVTETSETSTSQTETTRVKYTYDTEDFAQNISGDFRFSLDSGKATVIGYFGNGGAVTLPTYLNGYPVVAIGQNAFSGTGGGGGETITSISLPNGVERIGNKAFSSCTALKAVSLPSTLTYIGNYAFEGCTALTSVTIPESVSEVGKGCFASCSALTNVKMPQSGCVVGEECFAGCPYVVSP